MQDIEFKLTILTFGRVQTQIDLSESRDLLVLPNKGTDNNYIYVIRL
jgi:hypothetical protein